MTAVKPPETILKASVSGPPKRHPTKPSTATAKPIPPTSRRVKSGVIPASAWSATDKAPTLGGPRPQATADPTLLLGCLWPSRGPGSLHSKSLGTTGLPASVASGHALQAGLEPCSPCRLTASTVLVKRQSPVVPPLAENDKWL